MASLNVEGVNDEFGEFVEDACGHLKRKQHKHGEPVEEIVDRSTTKGPVGLHYTQ